MTEAMSRREFIERAAIAGVGLAALSEGAGFAAEAPEKATVVMAWRAKAVREGNPEAAVVREMVDSAVMKLAGKDSPAAAWAEYVKPTDTVEALARAWATVILAE